MSHPTGFLHEGRAYGLLAAAGLRVPRHGFLESGPLPFTPGEPIVLKGIADQLWHKSDKGAVHFGAFDLATLTAEAAAMRQRVAEHPWVGGLVCERVAFQRLPGLPTEALVSLKRDPEAGWLVVFGVGGLQADAWAALAPPMIWPPPSRTRPGCWPSCRACGAPSRDWSGRASPSSSSTRSSWMRRACPRPSTELERLSPPPSPPAPPWIRPGTRPW